VGTRSVLDTASSKGLVIYIFQVLCNLVVKELCYKPEGRGFNTR
jgi:hypothetical protein